MTATWARVALSSGLRSIRSASELDSRPAPTAQATASRAQGDTEPRQLVKTLEICEAQNL